MINLPSSNAGVPITDEDIREVNKDLTTVRSFDSDLAEELEDAWKNAKDGVLGYEIGVTRESIRNAALMRGQKFAA